MNRLALVLALTLAGVVSLSCSSSDNRADGCAADAGAEARNAGADAEDASLDVSDDAVDASVDVAAEQEDDAEASTDADGADQVAADAATE